MSRWMDDTDTWWAYFFPLSQRQGEDEKFTARYSESMKPIPWR